jgi:hypothetical protein
MDVVEVPRVHVVFHNTPKLKDTSKYYFEYVNKFIGKRKKRMEICKTVEGDLPNLGANGKKCYKGVDIYYKISKYIEPEYFIYKYLVNGLADKYPWFLRMLYNSDVQEKRHIIKEKHEYLRIAVEYEPRDEVIISSYDQLFVMYQIFLFIRVCERNGLSHNDMHSKNYRCVSQEPYQVKVDGYFYKIGYRDGVCVVPKVFDYGLSYIEKFNIPDSPEGHSEDMGPLSDYTSHAIYHDMAFYFGNVIKVISSQWNVKKEMSIEIKKCASYIYYRFWLPQRDEMKDHSKIPLAHDDLINIMMVKFQENRGHVHISFSDRHKLNGSVSDFIEYFVNYIVPDKIDIIREKLC